MELRRKWIASLVSPAAKKALIGELYKSIDMQMNFPHATGKGITNKSGLWTENTRTLTVFSHRCLLRLTFLYFALLGRHCKRRPPLAFSI